VFRQNGAWIRFNFTEGDGRHAGTLEAEGKAANPRKQIEYAHQFPHP